MENEEAMAGLLYTMWGNGSDTDWRILNDVLRHRWLKLARYVYQREVDLVANLADSANRKRTTERILNRKLRWSRQSEPRCSSIRTRTPPTL